MNGIVACAAVDCDVHAAVADIIVAFTAADERILFVISDVHKITPLKIN